MTSGVDAVAEAVRAHPAVSDVTLIGSRARGTPNPYSDWDYDVATDDFGAVAQALPALVEPLQPLCSLWDPLAGHGCYMTILSGPTKIDLLFDAPAQVRPPYDVSAANLADVDAHFWDWSLWLTSKIAGGKDDVVEAELVKMSGYILEPMGVAATPSDLVAAVDSYLAARDRLEVDFDVRVGRRLASEVEPVVRRCLGER